MEVNLSIAPDGFCAALMSLNNAFVNTRPGVFEVYVPAPECYGFAWSRALPKLEEDESVVVPPFNIDSRRKELLGARHAIALGEIGVKKIISAR